ncbi:hypothetical protein [Campylobacter sp. CCUG 57310]|uniref:hypothetical protein n=1 Tax=Campylobacter sp. CCUG 57310 TaxID=2517362 RepID=UPI001564D595|nr:hypothetical protein [Campylobacter sp. CCUG 57310]QKF93163.1 hypothetical protein CORI_2016 [Campylobacter sp. CCUG 57310]
MSEFEKINLYLEEVKIQNNKASNRLFDINDDLKDARDTMTSSFYANNTLKKIYEIYPELNESMSKVLDGSEEGLERFENLGWILKEADGLEHKNRLNTAIKLYEELLSKADEGYFKLAAQAGIYRCNTQNPQIQNKPFKEPLKQANLHINCALSYLYEIIYIIDEVQEKNFKSKLHECKSKSKLREEVKKEVATAAFYLISAKQKLGENILQEGLSQALKQEYDELISALKNASELEKKGELKEAREFYAKISSSNLHYFSLRGEAGLYRCD